MNKRAIIAIIGRPNVGKSTLFNRIIGRRYAIVTAEAGTTRDRIYAKADWNGRIFTLIDTGGWISKSANSLQEIMNKQIENALNEANIIFFVCDGKEGCTPIDLELASSLRKFNKPVFLLINKKDSPQKSYLIDPEFYKLGFSKIFTISAEHGLGIDEVLDEAMILLPPEEISSQPEPIKIAIVGKPNVGKSSIINSILGTDRLVISELPGTTRDTIDIFFQYEDKNYCFVDTAGIKKKSKAKDLPELISIIKAKNSIEKADVILLVLDSTTGIHHMDATIAGYAYDKFKPIGIIYNKIDLLPQKKILSSLKDEINHRLSFLKFAPKAFVSAKTGENIKTLFNIINELYYAYSYRIPTSQLNEIFEKSLKNYTLGQYKNRPIKIRYFTQVSIKPPTFVGFTNRKIKIRQESIKYLENIIRKYYDFMKVPMRFKIKCNKKLASEKVN